ncbi:serine endopeptidase [Chryseobacterium nematophagum]|uniref:Serine endopeptidase n=1 Tax=Chryseobacterium nematophagum TaxID=2305228 RepID=A0A3M7LBD9_9FLAO|nr:microviridin/marinostatin family tricyclic proteinase inhibitor [Chryseobacterium nematophagum]RMZ59529.1 serine endopeptidase [Chryseobacterium nematophagum]
MKLKNSHKTPFFATLLEKQCKDSETIKGGINTSAPERDFVTTEIVETMAIQEKILDYTMKFPSDGDDEASFSIRE